jgi:hypothetical protein
MRKQLGEVSGWMGKGLAIVILLATAFIVFELTANYRIAHPEPGTYGTIIVFGCVTASLVFLIGHALRRILVAGGNSARDSRSDQEI